MGLDGVELIMAYEEAFGIQFTDEDAVKIRTPRDVIDFVASKVEVTSETICFEQRAFYTLRAALLELTAVQRHALRPRTPLAHVFPLAPAADVARRLSDKLALSHRVPIDRLSTMGDLSRWLSENAPRALKRDQPWSREQIARVVKQITIAQLGDVPYGENQRFVQDFGVD
jgi:hypothetical protein